MTRRWDPTLHDAERPFELSATPVSFEGRRAGLLVVDMQAADMVIAPESPLARSRPAIASYWNTRIADVVLPATRRLIGAFRGAGLDVVYTRNGPITASAG